MVHLLGEQIHGGGERERLARANKNLDERYDIDPCLRIARAGSSRKRTTGAKEFQLRHISIGDLF
jgi:hypothetical protein